MDGARKYARVPVGGGLDVDDGECGGPPVALGNAGVAYALHADIVVAHGQIAERDRVACGGETLPRGIGGQLVLDNEVRGVAVPSQSGFALEIVAGNVEVVRRLTLHQGKSQQEIVLRTHQIAGKIGGRIKIRRTIG